MQAYREQRRASRSLPNGIPPPEPATVEERREAEIMARNDEIFARDHVSMWWCGAGYIASCALAIVVVPVLYPPAKWCGPLLLRFKWVLLSSAIGKGVVPMLYPPAKS